MGTVGELGNRQTSVTELRSLTTGEYQFPLIRCSALALMLLIASFISPAIPQAVPNHPGGDGAGRDE